MFKSRIHYWLPRIIAMLFIVLVSLFSLDAFRDYSNLSEVVLVFIMHLIPSFLLTIVTVVAWRWRLTGGILFVLIGLVSILFYNTYWHILTFLLVSLPPILLGLLFIWEAQWHHPDVTDNSENFHPDKLI